MLLVLLFCFMLCVVLCEMGGWFIVLGCVLQVAVGLVACGLRALDVECLLFCVELSFRCCVFGVDC